MKRKTQSRKPKYDLWDHVIDCCGIDEAMRLNYLFVLAKLAPDLLPGKDLKSDVEELFNG
jgi:hypothetical protein